MAKNETAHKHNHKPRREEKKQLIREDLFRAAQIVVGRTGYATARVSEITNEANVAQGTFYNYFESQQDLFDQLLPSMGAELLDFIRERVRGAPSSLERERRSFKAFFEFISRKPEFYRILYEAETYAPRAFQVHMDQIAEHYVRTLKRDHASGELTVSDEDQIEPLAYIMMGARHYLCMRFARSEGRFVDLPEWVVETYMTLIRTGVYRERGGPRS